VDIDYKGTFDDMLK